MTIPNYDFQLEGGKRQELHLNNGNQPLQPGVPTDLNSNTNWKFSETLETHIHCVGMSIGGPKFQPTEWGFLYLWRDAAHFTLMLPCGEGQPQHFYQHMGDTPIVIPPGGNYCFRRWFSELSVPRSIFADVLFTMHQP